MAQEKNNNSDDDMQDIRYTNSQLDYETSHINNLASIFPYPNLYNQQSNQAILQLLTQLQHNEENDKLKKDHENLKENLKRLVNLNDKRNEELEEKLKKVNEENNELKKNYENLHEV